MLPNDSKDWLFDKVATHLHLGSAQRFANQQNEALAAYARSHRLLVSCFQGCDLCDTLHRHSNGRSPAPLLGRDDEGGRRLGHCGATCFETKECALHAKQSTSMWILFEHRFGANALFTLVKYVTPKLHVYSSYMYLKVNLIPC